MNQFSENLITNHKFKRDLRFSQLEEDTTWLYRYKAIWCQDYRYSQLFKLHISMSRHTNNGSWHGQLNVHKSRKTNEQEKNKKSVNSERRKEQQKACCKFAIGVCKWNLQLEFDLQQVTLKIFLGFFKIIKG